MSGVQRQAARRGAVVGATLVLVLLAFAVLGPALITKDPRASDIGHGLSALGAPLPPSADALLGTDQLGRDVCARVIAGAGTSLAVAGLAMLLALAIGLPIGLCAGYAGGAIDRALMSLVDFVLAFPSVLLAILLAALFRHSDLASSIAPTVLTLGFTSWPTAARLVRSKVRVIARSERITAARAIGAGPARIVWHHIVPAIAGLAAAAAALGFAQSLLNEATLSYLGLGPPPPAPTWGRMLYEGRAYYRTAPHLVIAPGVAILVAVAAFTWLGEALRAAFDARDRAARERGAAA